MPVRKQPGRKRSGVARKVRKPMAPPTRIEQDLSRYSRAREREQAQRTRKRGQS